VINFGKWFDSFRSDVFMTENGKRVVRKEEMWSAYEKVLAKATRWLDENLHAGSIAIWHGYSPAKKDDIACGVLSARTQGVYRIVKPYLGKAQYFIDAGCALRTLPGGYDPSHQHFLLPGAKDVEVLFLLRLLEALDPPRSAAPAGDCA